MTITQPSVGSRTDRGEIGFDAGPNRQFLIFPKSLRAFSGKTVVGIKYDLLDSPPVPKSQRVSVSRPSRRAKPKPIARIRRQKPELIDERRIVAFKLAREEEDEGYTEIKRQVRRAMAALEEGKAVAAFNLLKRIVGD